MNILSRYIKLFPFIILLTACNESYKGDSTYYKEDFKIQKNQLTQINEYDYFHYEGYVEKIDGEYKIQSPLYVSTNYYYYDYENFEEINEFESDFFSYNTNKIIKQKTNGNIVTKEIPSNNICFNFNDFTYECNGLETLHYFPNNEYYYSTENNTFVFNNKTYEFDTYFEYEYKTTIHTNLGNIETKKIWFDTYSVNELQEIINIYGYYFINPDIGVVKMEYTEEVLNSSRYTNFEYILIETNRI